MAAIDTLCALVEIEIVEIPPLAEGLHPRTQPFIKRIVRTYESETRAEEDLELLGEANPDIHYRIDKIVHIER